MYQAPSMDSFQPARDALRHLFRRHPIATLDQLFAALKTRSRMTVFRRLSLLGYLSSCNHAGRYYTLRDVPEFDADGLWRHAGVLFSRDGTLKETVARLVVKADAGQLHGELQLCLGVRVHNTLAELVERGRIGRERLRTEYLYVGNDPARAAAQMARRAEMSPGAAAPKTDHRLAPSEVVEVLLEVIHGTVVQLDAQEVASRLVARGVSVTVAQVEDVFRHYGVEKKTARSRSRRSGR